MNNVVNMGRVDTEYKSNTHAGFKGEILVSEGPCLTPSKNVFILNVEVLFFSFRYFFRSAFPRARSSIEQNIAAHTVPDKIVNNTVERF